MASPVQLVVATHYSANQRLTTSSKRFATLLLTAAASDRRNFNAPAGFHHEAGAKAASIWCGPDNSQTGPRAPEPKVTNSFDKQV